MNFGETLASWYLRFNGFFVLPNFVIHQVEDYIPRSTDCDLLAVRFPHTFEEIGGQDIDYDSDDFFLEHGLDLKDGIVGLIVEVKTGITNTKAKESIKSKFSKERLQYCIERLGFFQKEVVPEIAMALYSNQFIGPEDIPIGSFTKYFIGKLLIAENPPRHDEIRPCMIKSLEDVDDFIFERVRKYDRKYRDRTLFSSDLIQYFTWKEKLNKSRNYIPELS